MDTTLILLGTALAVGLAAGAFLYVRRRRGGEEPYYHFRPRAATDGCATRRGRPGTRASATTAARR